MIKKNSNMLQCTAPALPGSVFTPDQQQDFHRTLIEFKDLFQLIRTAHERRLAEGKFTYGHSIDHDLCVAAMGHAIVYARHNAGIAAPSKRAVMAATLTHSYDRLGFGPEQVEQWLKSSLDSEVERQATYRAVIVHDKPNKDKVTDTPGVEDILADADKLATLLFYSLFRTGQYLPHKPTLAIGCLSGMTPGADYRHANVALDNLFGVLEWVDDKAWFVTPEAKEVATALEPPLRFFVEVIKAQFEAIGLGTLPV